jgi:LysR family transcriptional regulator, nod-box dependent transcriptional activator
VTTFSFASLPALVKGTNRIALVQNSLAKTMTRTGGLAITKPPLALPPLEQAVQWHSYRTRDPALIWIRSQLKQAAGDRPS